jgi:hypothetical protein
VFAVTLLAVSKGQLAVCIALFLPDRQTCVYKYTEVKHTVLKWPFSTHICWRGEMPRNLRWMVKETDCEIVRLQKKQLLNAFMGRKITFRAIIVKSLIKERNAVCVCLTHWRVRNISAAIKLFCILWCCTYTSRDQSIFTYHWCADDMYSYSPDRCSACPLVCCWRYMYKPDISVFRMVSPFAVIQYPCVSLGQCFSNRVSQNTVRCSERNNGIIT